MNKFLFSIALVFCFSVCIISGREGSEVGVKFQIGKANYTTVYTTVNQEFSLKGSGRKTAGVDECKCKNGKCMRRCDVEKTTPCINEEMVCVCNPEFGKKGEGECQYCNCGQGFNCTFYYWSFYGYWEKTCICPKGFYEERKSNSLDNFCKAECNVMRPCKNGGTCSFKRCVCPPDTSGELCEDILSCSECGNRLEVNCLYDQSEQSGYCSCKNSSLVYDYEAKICRPCPCENGVCDYEISYTGKKLKCDCYFGYKEFNGYCKKCECDYRAIGGCKFDAKGERICTCRDGYYERNGLCLPCDCTRNSDTETKCIMTGNVKYCFCKKGFEDINGYCEDIDECERNNSCHPSTTCYNTVSSFRCECPDGYKGKYGKVVEPGENCIDINECLEMRNPCLFYDNVKCVNLPGSYKCECLHGYKPRSYLDEPHRTTCIKTKKHWGPSVIVVGTSLIFIAISVSMHKRVKRRAANSS